MGTIEGQNESKIVNLINEINELMKIRCDQIAHEHHKHRDGIWSIEIDLWLNKLTVSHKGYLWDYSVTRTPQNMISALEHFRDALDKSVKEFKRGDS